MDCFAVLFSPAPLSIDAVARDGGPRSAMLFELSALRLIWINKAKSRGR